MRGALDGHDTAIVDTRGVEDFETVRTVVGPPAEAVASAGLRWTGDGVRPAGQVPGSEVPTLLVHEVTPGPAPTRRLGGSETPTVMMFDAIEAPPEPKVTAPAPSAPKKPAGGRKEGRSRTPGSETPTLVVTEPAERVREPLPEPTPTPVPARTHTPAPVRTPTPAPAPAPTPPSEAETIRAGDVPPPALIRETASGPRPERSESVRSTADTQPTHPPPEYLQSEEPPLEMQEEELPRGARLTERVEDPMAGTQPVVTMEPRIRLAAIVILALVASGLVLGAFYYAQARIEGASERSMLDWLAKRSAGRTGALANLIEREMLAGRPDRAARIARGMAVASTGQSLSVVRPGGTLAFVDDDWSSYRAVLEAVCDEEGLDARTTSAGEDAAKSVQRWLGSADPGIQNLGTSTCAAVKKPPRPVARRKADLPVAFSEHVSKAGPGEVVSWVDDDGDKRSQVVVQPVVGTTACSGCHVSAGPEAPLGYLVVRTPLEPIDQILSAGRGTMLLTGVVAAILIVLLLLLAVRVFAAEASSS